MDNKLKDFLTSAHGKFADSTHDDTLNVLAVCGDGPSDLQKWVGYMFGWQGLFTKDSYHPVADYNRVDVVLLTNLYHRRYNYREKDQLADHWDLGKAFRLVFSEMTLKEIRRHLAKKPEEARSSLQKGLSDSVNHWALPEEKKNQLLWDVVGDADFNTASKARLSAFLERCKAEIAGAQEHLEVDTLDATLGEVRRPSPKIRGRTSAS